MTGDKPRPGRRSIRLKGYDYLQEGAYFVTICTRDREPLLGRIADGQMVLSESGMVVARSWLWLAERYPFVELDQWVVMPNHVHGIMILRRGGSRTAPTKPLGRLVGAFKTVSAKRINQIRGVPGGSVWQRNYYERVVRDDDELYRRSRYVLDNPVQWETDENNPARTAGATPAAFVPVSCGLQGEGTCQPG